MSDTADSKAPVWPDRAVVQLGDVLDEALGEMKDLRLTPEQAVIVRRAAKRRIELSLQLVSVRNEKAIKPIRAEIAAVMATLASIGEARAALVTQRLQQFVARVIGRLIDAIPL